MVNTQFPCIHGYRYHVPPTKALFIAAHQVPTDVTWVHALNAINNNYFLET